MGGTQKINCTNSTHYYCNFPFSIRYTVYLCTNLKWEKSTYDPSTYVPLILWRPSQDLPCSETNIIFKDQAVVNKRRNQLIKDGPKTMCFKEENLSTGERL